MNTWERYVAKLSLTLFAGITFALVSLFLVIDFGDWLSYYLGKPPLDVALLFWLRSHLAFSHLMPAALVLSSALTITVIRRRGEWTALRALGGAPSSLLRPVLLVSGVLACGVIAFDEFVVSRSGPESEQLMLTRFNHRSGDFFAVYSPRRWFRAGDALVNVRGEVNPERLEDVRVFRLGPAHELVEWIDARSLRFIAHGRWIASGAVVTRLEGATVKEGPRGELELSLALAPEATQLVTGRPQWMSSKRLNKQLELLDALALPTEATRYALHQRFAVPVAVLAAALIVMLLGLRAQASVPRALLEGAVLYGALFVAGMVTRSLAVNGHVTPPLAAWLLPMGLGAVGALFAFASRRSAS